MRLRPPIENNKIQELLPISIVLILAYGMRVLQPDIFIIGWDLPNHVVSSMRLYGTSLFGTGNTGNINQNFFYQLFVFNHGYTTRLIPYILYEFFFSLAGITITESSLTLVHSLLGILSLAAIYYFLRLNFSRKISLISIVIISLTPVHLGLSRVHVGYQIIQLIFFYLSLAFLHQLITKPKKQTKFFYFLSTFFYIGSENAFPIGLGFHLLYIYLHLPNKSLTDFFKGIRKIYFSPLTFFFVIIPIGIYALFTIQLLQQHITNGYILKATSKASTLGPILRYPLASFLLVGPTALFFSAALCKISQIKKSAILQYFVIQIFIYFVLLCKMNVNVAYILYILPPITAMVVAIFSKRLLMLSSILLGTLALSLSIIFNVNIGFPTMYTYGAQYFNPNNGLKTLGYLIRSNIFPITDSHNDNGITTKKLNLFTGFPSGYYYLGAFNYGRPFQYSLDSTKQKPPYLSPANNFLLAKWLTYDKKFYYRQIGIIVTEANNEIDSYVSKHDIPLIGYITDGNKKLIALYSNIKNKQFHNYDINIYDKKFDQQFGKMDSFNFPLTGYELF